MPVGEGIYDPVCTMVRELTEAKGAIVIVFDGIKGSGFSVQADLETQMNLPEVLEKMANDIRESIKRGFQ